MRLWLSAAIALFICMPVCHAALMWKNPSVDLKAEAGASEVVTEYAFTNTGNASVTIKEITTGCDCTTPDIAKRTFAAGESGIVKVTFRLGDRTGEQRKTITIRTDDPANPESLLGLNVTIPQLWRVSPRFLYWRQGEAAKSQEIRIFVAGEKPQRLVAAEVLEGGVKAELREDVPGKAYTLIVTPAGTAVETKAIIIVRPEDKTLPLVPAIYASVIVDHPEKSATTEPAK